MTSATAPYKGINCYGKKRKPISADDTLHSVHSVNKLVELLTLLRRKRDVYSHEAFVKAILFNYALHIAKTICSFCHQCCLLTPRES